MGCHQELCLNWTGQGCICSVMDVEPVIVEPDDYNIYGAEEDEA